MLPSALAGAFAGILAIFRWRDDYLRLSLTAFLYESERLKFTTRTTDLYKSELGEEQVLSNFVTRLAIIGTEDKAAYLAEWRQTSATRVTAPGNQHER